MADNSDNNKRIAKNSLVLYIRTLVMMFISLYTGRVVLEVLGFEDFGIYNAVGGVVTMLSFLNASMIGATQRFLTYELGRNNQGEFNKVFSTSIFIHAIIALIVLLLGETIGLWFFKTQMNIPPDRMYAAMWVYQFSIFAYMVSIMSVPYYAVVVAHERMRAFAYFSITDAVLKLTILYLILYLKGDRLILYALLMFSIQVFIRFLYGIYCRREFREIVFHWKYDKSFLKQILSFAGWVFNSGVAYVTYTHGVTLLLNIFFGPLINAARGIALQVQSAAMSLCRNVQLALNPQIVKSYAQNDLPYMHKLVFASSRYSFFSLLFLALPILFETKFVMELWLKNVPDHTVNFVRLVIVISLFEILLDPIAKAAHATGRIKKYQLCEAGLMILILPISYLVLKAGYPPESVYIVHISIIIIAQFVKLKIVSSLIDLSLKDYLAKVVLVIIKVSFFALLLPSLCYFFYSGEGWLKSVLLCIVASLSTFATIYIVGMGQKERALAKSYIKKLLSIR